MIELFIAVIALGVAVYVIWKSLDVTSCHRELRALERHFNALCDDMLEWQIKTSKLEDKAEEFARWDQDIRDGIIALKTENRDQAAYIGTLTDRLNEQDKTLKEIDDDINNINHRLGEHRQEVHGKINQTYNRINTVGQEIRGDLSVTNVSVEELKVKLAQYQAEQQRMQSAMKENRDALVKWFGGEL